MKIKPLPSLDYLHERLRYEVENGMLYWRPKKVVHPNDASWNTRYASKPAGSKFKNGYHYLTLDGSKCLVHRIIWKMVTGQEPKELVDHRDLNPSNNRFENLREATETENRCNSKIRGNASGYKGVYRHGNGWRVQVRHEGKLHQRGTYSTTEKAHEVYKDASAVLHGPFARF